MVYKMTIRAVRATVVLLLVFAFVFVWFRQTTDDAQTIDVLTQAE